MQLRLSKNQKIREQLIKKMNEHKMVKSISGQNNQMKTARTFFKDRNGCMHIAVDKPPSTN